MRIKFFITMSCCWNRHMAPRYLRWLSLSVNTLTDSSIGSMTPVSSVL